MIVNWPIVLSPILRASLVAEIWSMECYGVAIYKAFNLIVGVILDDALLNKDAEIVFPLGRADAKQHSHEELLNPTTPTNVKPSITGTSIDKLTPLFALMDADVDNVLT